MKIDLSGQLWMLLERRFVPVTQEVQYKLRATQSSPVREELGETITYRETTAFRLGVDYH